MFYGALMNTTTLEQYQSFIETRIIDTCSEEQDNRFAVVAGSLFEATTYADCNDGHTYTVVTVQVCDGVHSPFDSDGMRTNYTDNAVTEAYVYADNERAANMMFIALLSGALASFN